MAVVLLGAVLHAAWNTLVRRAADKLLDTVLITSGAGILTAVLLPALPLPATESWPYLAASVLIHVIYFAVVALAYHGAELSFAYPIMRGSAPVLSAVAVALLLNETPTLGGWLGIFLVSGGVLLLAADAWRTGKLRKGPTILALTNAGVIAVYTLVDGQGARLSGHAFSYTGWMFLLTAVLLLGLSFALKGRRVIDHVRHGWQRGLLGGASTLASYGLALWAMTQAPIALVAALRETSVVFAAIMAALFLAEPVTRLRAVSIITVAAGAVAIKIF
ncbi:MAG TPA: EamA family transporter [Acidiferrobacterales bacterium]|nr:EamA family transporter [Acidiferrobacterales bacterium]